MESRKERAIKNKFWLGAPALTLWQRIKLEIKLRAWELGHQRELKKIKGQIDKAFRKGLK